MQNQNRTCSQRYHAGLSLASTILVLAVILAGCGDSSTTVRAVRLGGTTIDSSMMIAVGTITEIGRAHV